MQVPDGKENAGDTGNASSPSEVVPAQPNSQNSPSVNAGADVVGNTASGTAVDTPASSTPADQVAKKEGADASKPVFKAKKRQVIDTELWYRCIEQNLKHNRWWHTVDGMKLVGWG